MPELDLLAALIGAAFAAGFIDAIAGGGGLIALPALLLAGLSPLEALSTNKVQAIFGSGTAALSYAAAGQVDLRSQAGEAAIACAAGAAGAALASVVPTDGLRLILPFILIAIAVFFAVKPGLSDEDQHRRLSPTAFMAFFVPLIGAYDGLIGPGAGSFYMIGFVTLAGFGVLKATAHTKLLNFASNLGGLVVFAIGGAPLWTIGLSMGLAQVVGARLGSKLAMKRGARLIKPLLVLTSVALALKLLL